LKRAFILLHSDFWSVRRRRGGTVGKAQTVSSSVVLDVLGNNHIITVSHEKYRLLVCAKEEG
jgi:hypothetical protein